MNKKLGSPFPSNMFLKQSRHGNETTKATAVLDRNYLLSQSHQYIIPKHLIVNQLPLSIYGYISLIHACNPFDTVVIHRVSWCFGDQ